MNQHYLISTEIVPADRIADCRRNYNWLETSIYLLGDYMKKKRKNKNLANNVLFFLATFFSVLFLAIPLILKFPCVYNWVTSFLSTMGTYKASYFEACGAMMGTFLAVTSAIWIQNRSEAKQRNDVIKKCATIVYFDIDKFYKENDIFSSRVIDLQKASAQHKKSKANILKDFEQWRQYASIHIDSDWITTVAELGIVLDKQTIDEIYGFYGKIEYIKNKLDTVVDLSCDDIKMITTQLTDIGERKTYYRPNKTIVNIIKQLEDLIETLD